MIFTKRIAELQAQLEESTQLHAALTAENARLVALVTEHEANIAALQEANDKFSAADTEQRATIETLTAERDQLAEKVGKVEATIQEQVTQRIAEAGVPAIKRAPVDTSASAERASGTPRQRLAAITNKQISKN